ncbi:anti-sigma factor [Priestia megaterium]|uniref:anti sigma factor C-terminal domain-containing protein n=1 Tax=Priestia megaterium TaxID=1404 RepID=UPI00228261CB|nr:anti sigma factor C-terminal domain-containing protein [Priestia megaterium]MCY9026604.1 anti-sigma factor [Priestia megaterium]
MKKDNDFPIKDPDFTNLVKKAKRNSMIRIVLISFSISVLVILLTYFLGNYMMNQTINKQTSDDASWHSIEGANIEQQGTSFNHSLFSATSKTEFVKNLDGIPVPWISEEKVYSLFGKSALITSEGPSKLQEVNDKRTPSYFNGERAIEFVPPGVKAPLFDDRNILEHIDDNKVVEMAFSFNRGYKIKDVQKIFNKNLSWYWVDTFDQSDINTYNELNKSKETSLTVSGEEAIGFQSSSQVNSEAKIFINTLNSLKDTGTHKHAANNIIQNITHNQTKDLSPENLKIIGVVVTGTPSEIKKYNNLSFIRTASLGVTIDKY